MNFEVTNHEVCVDQIQVIVVSSASLFHIGDSHAIQLTSTFDTPPESLIIGPLVPVVPKG